jgi:serine/threonine-protein kinase
LTYRPVNDWANEENHMPRTKNVLASLGTLLVISALAVGACSPPPTVPATQPATAAPLPTSPPATLGDAQPGPVPATSVKLHGANELAIAADGTLYLSQCGDTDVAPQIIKVDTAGLLSPIVETMPGAVSGDGGPALTAGIGCAIGLAVDSAGNLLVADFFGNRIRRIDPNGIITTVAGSSDEVGFGGDGGPATAAQLAHPTNIALDAAGNLYIVDRDNARIRKVDPQGIITTVAGTGEQGFSGDGGPATAAQL